jgi:small subunit ribosomal protein S17
MADEENVDQEIEAAEERMEAEGSPVEPEAPTSDEPEAEAAVADEPEAAQSPATEVEAEERTTAEEEPAPPPSSAAESDEPAEILKPKERRRRARQLRQAPTRATRTPQERQEERDALRAQNAKARTHRRHKVRAKKPAASAAVELAEPQMRGTQKTRQGIVVSDKAAKTITVRIDTSRRHLRYQKIVRSSKTLHAHDEHDEAHEGDLVRLVETRPLSATKRWRLVEIVERAQ